jgi:type VI secretion system secreted protein VgrG
MRTRTLADDGGGVVGGSGGARATHLLECIEKDALFFPERRPKPKIHGTQTAFVIGDAPEGTVEVDAMGRVKLAFRWDRRDPTGGAPTRMVRVSQGSAGSGFGLVTLPRVGEEVVVTYADGDPDEPLVVGRVHNATVVTPLLLPDKDKTLMLWRSRSFSPSGPGSGFNQILMDDMQGRERLELHAERDFKSETGRMSVTSVGKNEKKRVRGSSSTSIGGAQTISSGSTSHNTGPYKLQADKIEEIAAGEFDTTAAIRRDTSLTHDIQTQVMTVTSFGAIQVSTADFYLDAPRIVLITNAASVFLDWDKIQLTSHGSIELEAPNIKLTSSGTIEINGAVVDIKGQPIKLNS